MHRLTQRPRRATLPDEARPATTLAAFAAWAAVNQHRAVKTHGRGALMDLESALPTLRVLFVEDDALVRELTQELLAGEDREVCACASAEEALQELERGRFDLLITDVSLPSMSGMALAHRFIALHPAAAVIIASGYPLELGFDRHGANWRSIAKPIEAEQLDALIEELCAPRRRG
jgi:CheY-like chemotaxis protein